MKDIFEDVQRWQKAGEQLALATVIKVDGSAPRSEGAKMAITASGKIAGSVSGGCVESAVAQEAQAVLTSGTPTIARYGINKAMMWDVGLSCGGAIDVFIEPLVQPLAINPEQTYAVATIVRGPRNIGSKIFIASDGTVTGTLGDAVLQATAIEQALPLMADGQSKTVTIGDIDVFIDSNVPDPRLIIVGAVHIAIGLCQMASQAGFAVSVIDPRPALCNHERFPLARALIIEWPDDALPSLPLDENTYVAVLTHDEKFDDPTLLRVLPTRARYVGAIGSQKTQAARRARLLEAGVSQDAVDRLHGPIGLDIGAQSPDEIAVAILAEMIATKYHRSGIRLREQTAAHIHA